MFEMFKKVFNALTGKEEMVPVVEAEVAAEVAAEPVVEAPVEVPAPAVAPSAGNEVDEEMDPARHVVAEGKMWAIKAPGVKEALEVHAKKKDAVASATEMCKALKSELFIHGKDGKIKDRSSFGNDSPKRKG